MLAFFPRDRPEARAFFGRWLVAYCFCCKWAMREEGKSPKDLDGWLKPEELETLVGQRYGRWSDLHRVQVVANARGVGL